MDEYTARSGQCKSRMISFSIVTSMKACESATERILLWLHRQGSGWVQISCTPGLTLELIADTIGAGV